MSSCAFVSSNKITEYKFDDLNSTIEVWIYSITESYLEAVYRFESKGYYGLTKAFICSN